MRARGPLRDAAEELRPLWSLLGPAATGATLLHGEDFLPLLLGCLLTVALADALLPPTRGSDPRAVRELPLLRQVLLHAHLPVHALLLLAAAQVWSLGSLAPLDALGLVLGFGIYACAFGINPAHELIHRPGRLSRAWGGLTLALVAYGTFKVEHLRGHHRLVATEADPSSAPRGRGLYAHLPRAIAGNLRAAFRLEARRLRVAGRSPWSLRNEALAWTLLSGALALGLGLWLGPGGLVFFALQALVAVLSLELTNYVEHYGLRRQRDARGRLEPVGRDHAWSSPVRFSNALFFNVQRHAHHHARPRLPYPHLQVDPEGPVLPAGHPAMMALALLPPLWRRVVDPRLPEAARISSSAPSRRPARGGAGR